MRVCFVLGSLAALTGGNAIALQHARAAALAGMDVTVTAMADPAGVGPAAIGVPETVRVLPLPLAQARPHDVVVATFWRTVYTLPDFDAATWLYFVQSVETRFVPRERPLERAAADFSYLVDMPVVTTGAWIQAFLAERFGRRSTLAPIFVDPAVHRPDGPAVAPRRAGRLRVLVEGPLRMRLKNVPRALHLARRSTAPEIWLMTQTRAPFYPGVDRVFSGVPPAATGAIYRSCDVVLRLSFVEGVPLVPLEMMACGGTVVTYAVTGHDDYVAHERNGLVVPLGDEDAALDAIDRLASDPVLLSCLKAGALATVAARPGRDDASGLFLAVLEDVAASGFDRDAACRTVRRLRRNLLGCEGPLRSRAPRAGAELMPVQRAKGLWSVLEAHVLTGRRRPEFAGYLDF